jgi:glutamate synthase domain-containing protein 2
VIVSEVLRVPAELINAMALDAYKISVYNSAIQAIGCFGMHPCHTNNFSVGVVTQKEHLRERLIIDESAARLEIFLVVWSKLIKFLSRSCGHSYLIGFELSDLTT